MGCHQVQFFFHPPTPPRTVCFNSGHRPLPVLWGSGPAARGRVIVDDSECDFSSRSAYNLKPVAYLSPMRTPPRKSSTPPQGFDRRRTGIISPFPLQLSDFNSSGGAPIPVFGIGVEITQYSALYSDTFLFY